jgi:hypothetical protein
MNKSLRRILTVSLAVLLSLSNSQTAFAVDEFDIEGRLAASPNSGACAFTGGFVSGLSWKFLANLNSQITKVQVGMGANATPTSPQTVEIYSDSSGVPGNLIGTLNYTSKRAVTIGGLSTFVATNPITVTSGNYYWLKINSSNTCPTSTLVFNGSALTLNLYDGGLIIRYFGQYYYGYSTYMAIFGEPVNMSPSAPTSVVATATGKRSATVSFAAPASNGGSAVTSYTATSSPGGITKTLTQSGGGNFTFDNLEPSTAYTFAVTATNANGTSAAATSNSIKTLALDVASISALSFADDGTGTAGKIVWAGMNIDRVLYTGPAQFYPGPFKYGAFTSGWNGLIRNLKPDTTYTVSINAHSADGVGGEKSLTFKTNASSNVLTDSKTSTDPNGGIVVNIGLERGFYWLSILETWLNDNTFVTGEASNMYVLLKKFFQLETSPNSINIKVPTSRVSDVVATSLTPTTCSVISTTENRDDAGLVTALSGGTCTISYTVSGGSSAPATMVRDFVFSKYVSSPQSFACGDGFYTINAGIVSAGESCTGAVTIDPSATSIVFGAFQDSTMTSISIPNSVTAIPNNAFASSAKLTKVELGNAVTSIGIFAFAGTGLVSISLPVALRTIGIGAFYGTSLTSITIPEGTTDVSYKAFSGNKKLETIIIPSTITDMSELALTYSWFKTVNYCGSNASVLAAIAKQPVTATCVAPVPAP